MEAADGVQSECTDQEKLKKRKIRMSEKKRKRLKEQSETAEDAAAASAASDSEAKEEPVVGYDESAKNVEIVKHCKADNI